MSSNRSINSKRDLKKPPWPLTSSGQRRPAWHGYATALALVALGGGVRLVLFSTLGTRFPFATFLPAVILAPLLGGLGPGVLATVLSILLADYFLIEPGGSFHFDELFMWPVLVPLAASCVAIAVMAGRLRSTSDRLAEELAAIVDSSEDAIIGQSLEGIITSWNAGAEKMFGYCAQEAIGRPLDLLLPPEQAAEHTSILARVAQGESFRQVESPRIRKDGIRIPISATLSPIRESGGRVIGVSEVARDISEKKQAEEQLMRTREHNDFLAQLIRDSSQPVGVRSMDGRVILVNRAFEELTGYSAGELSALEGTAPLTPPEWAIVEAPILAKQRRTGQPVRYEKEYSRKDGSRVAVEVFCHLQCGPGGEPERYYVFITDITERKRTEGALQAALDRMSALIHSIRDEIWFADAAGQFTLVNPAGGHAFNLDQQTTTITGVRELAQNLEVLRPDGTPRPVEEAPPLRALRGEVLPHEEELVRTPATGELRHREVSAAPVRDKEGHIIGSVSVVRDITSFRRAEAALRESEEQYRTLFETLIEGFCTVEMRFDERERPVDYRFLEINPAFEKHTGVKNAVGKWVSEFDPNHETHWLEFFGHVARTGEPTRMENPSKAGTEWFEVCAYRIGGPESRKLGILFNNVTERRRHHEELEERVEARTAELRGALQALEGEMATRRRLEQEVLAISEREQARLGRELHDDLGQQIAGIAMLTRRMGEQLQIEGSACASQCEKLGGFLRNAIQTTRHVAKSLYPVGLEIGGIRTALEALAIHTEALTQIHCRAVIDKDFQVGKEARIHVFRIVQESIANAIKHAEPKRITIECSVREGTHTVSVINDGAPFRPPATDHPGMGLHLFQYRARLLGAALEVGPGEHGIGTRVHCRFSSPLLPS